MKEDDVAPAAGIAMFCEIAEDFMSRIFGFEPGDYFITDESSLFEFTGVNDMALSDIQQKIREIYDIEMSNHASGNLLDIFAMIDYRQHDRPT